MQTISTARARSTSTTSSGRQPTCCENRHFSDELRRRCFVLEDEAEDSVPLQEVLLTQLTPARWQLGARVATPTRPSPAPLPPPTPAFQRLPRPSTGLTGRCNSDRCATHHGSGQHKPPLDPRQTPGRRVPLHLPAARRAYAARRCPSNPPDSEAGIQLKVTTNAAKTKNCRPLPKKRCATPWNIRITHRHPGAHQWLGYTLAMTTWAELGADYDNLLRGGSRNESPPPCAILAVLADR
ncbi:MAG: hypothetical protein IPG51_17525 [Chloroflexi bacterium]|nr:hypothetical protein [Chloroflexota bacterium]